MLPTIPSGTPTELTLPDYESLAMDTISLTPYEQNRPGARCDPSRVVIGVPLLNLVPGWTSVVRKCRHSDLKAVAWPSGSRELAAQSCVARQRMISTRWSKAISVPTTPSLSVL